MILAKNRQYLIDLFKQKKGKHDTGQAKDILPFGTKKTSAIRNKFNLLIGEYVRHICRLKLDESIIAQDDNDFEENVFCSNIANNVEFENEDERFDFIRFLEQYLFSGDKINPVHPYLFNFIKVDRDLKNETGKYAQFMSNVLVQREQSIMDIFENKKSEDILTELILSKMSGVKEDNKVKERAYEPLLPTFSKLYRDDIVYLSKHKDYFLNSFPLLTHFYMFMYACQIIYKFQQYSKADYKEVKPLYFALDWESISKRRSVVDDPFSYRYIKNSKNRLFPHIHAISQISHLVYEKEIIDEKGIVIPFVPYSVALDRVKQQGENQEQLFLQELNNWIQDYASIKNLEKPVISNTIEDAFKTLHDCIIQGVSDDVAKKFGDNIQNLASNQFIKNRGSLGQVLNIKHDFLLLLTAVSVKDKRIPLNELFVEFEKRGVTFDRYSKKEIIVVLDRLNIIDKKSDSGDAQYVKPIL
ncbi:MAG: DNA phosphorothioation-dependent restriction protein DptG [Bacillaceae bacterium]|nr:DNA phosphorothioation-dependent restriction protein DptG [Bacillaceae bacterium]